MDEKKKKMERSLPRFLKDDIEALLKGIENNSSVLDCLYNEVQGSINLAFYGNEITKEQADYLREEYLGWEV
ncbi:hypothetical protein [Scatolibacter rhodanostii]|uniref:hypothetical protein n=1 Tax=Scatolibacter rhodanostii TaxID=2014781 RepID=UPI000C0813D3|nr:hypothetical protein [Scatolibacter rhodanostii]